MWLIYAVLASAIWGLNYALDERILKSNISPYTLLACIGLAGGIVFATISYFSALKTDVSIVMQDKKNLWIFLATILSANLGTLFITLSIQAKNATFAALIELSYPLFTILFSWLLFKENYLNMKGVIGGIFIIFGAGLIMISES